ncbi:uncharacterized protein LOC107269767 [Cephus cinctus]|uniref:Uncharacterized protein LOC107269767 n=1 Tax=Cephus cinctus TaxID=211228 RepID=A0AAJ7C1B0_CEPCN|nr:uncharacterized protein LOC107269767 [Cephus cinctus]
MPQLQETDYFRKQEVGANLLDLDSDDERILDGNYILIGDGQSADTTPKKTPYPDANSHSNYNILGDGTRSFDSLSRNVNVPYSIANSHRNTFQDSNSHSNYDVFSDTSERNCKTSYENDSSHSLANSHGIYRILSESSDRTGEMKNNSQENLIPSGEMNYEIANSHSNYQIFYNSQTQYEVGDDGRGNFTRKSLIEAEEYERFQSLIRAQMKSTDVISPTRSETSHSSRSTEETSTTCDIEECLIQIEESLMNIEQNLLHVQDLDIPELKNLLYKSPSIEKSLFEVQDLLCTENIESAKRGKLFSLNIDDRTENLMYIRSKEDSPDSDRETFTNDENLLQFTDDKSLSDHAENSANVSSVMNSIFYANADKNVHFIPNSLSKTPVKSSFDRTKENIKASSFDYSDFTNDPNADTSFDDINYNLNNEVDEKGLSDRKKCHSRTNSLDENSIFQNSTDFGDPRKTSLENLFSDSKEYYLEINSKAKSEDALEQYDNESSVVKKSKSSRHTRRRSRDYRLAEVEAKAEEFRKKIENIISSRRSAIPNLEGTKVSLRNSKETPENRSNSLEKSPKIRKTSVDTINEKDKDSPTSKPFKPNSYEKRKRKKLANRTQSTENALVPSKLISLSLSLLLAALLQAVRCLTDLVEDAFRSVSYDRSGLLE